MDWCIGNEGKADDERERERVRGRENSEEMNMTTLAATLVSLIIFLFVLIEREGERKRNTSREKHFLDSSSSLSKILLARWVRQLQTTKENVSLSLVPSRKENTHQQHLLCARWLGEVLYGCLPTFIHLYVHSTPRYTIIIIILLFASYLFMALVGETEQKPFHKLI